MRQIVLPMSTVSVGCLFSDMEQIKDRLHNRLLSTSLSKLAIIAIEGLPLANVCLSLF